MFNKKYILVLLLLIVGICAISAASAADNATDAVAIDDADVDEIATTADNDLEKAVEETGGQEIISAPQDDDKLTQDQNDEKISSSSYMQYSVYLKDEYQISSYSNGKISGTVSPPPSYMPGYSFKLYVYDGYQNLLHTSKAFEGRATSFSYTIPAKTLLPGTYIIVAVNDYESHAMDVALLKVTGNAVIEANNYYANYMSGAVMTGRITDQTTKKPLNALSVKVVFTQGATSVTKYYTPNKDGYFSFVPPVGVGTWTVSMAPSVNFITGSAVKTATVLKSKVSVKAKKAVGYKGYKITLKATVKSYGKNVNEGQVAFKINGKTYKVNVKNGVATKKIKLKKIKTYKYSATYLGNKNLYKSAKSKAKAILKKSHKVKIYAPDKVNIYTGKKKTITIKVKTKEGKKVKNGWIKIQTRNGYIKKAVKNGKVKVKLTGVLNDVFVKMNGDDAYYKKSATKKYKIKYVPGTHKYKAAKTKYKLKTKFVCHCGKTYTHGGHGYWGPYFYHFYTIYVI
jgi:hypothetical protein